MKPVSTTADYADLARLPNFVGEIVDGELFVRLDWACEVFSPSTARCRTEPKSCLFSVWPKTDFTRKNNMLNYIDGVKIHVNTDFLFTWQCTVSHQTTDFVGLL